MFRSNDGSKSLLRLVLMITLALCLGACGGDDDDPTVPGGGGGGGGDGVYDPPDVTENALTGSLNVARNLHTSTLLRDGRVLVVGGFDGANRLASCELYNPETGTWSMTASMSEVRTFHTATLLADGRVFVCGGKNANYESIAWYEIFDPETETWSEVNYGAHVLDQHRMYWQREFHCTTLLNNGLMLITGGFNSFVINENNRPGEYLRWYEYYNSVLDECYPYDPPRPYMSHKRYCHSATTLPDGRVLLAGGYNNEEGYIPDCEIYDAVADTTITAAAMPRGSMWHEAHLMDDGRVLVAGGRNSTNGYTRECCLFNPATDSWTVTGSMREARKNPASAKLPDGRVIIGGNVTTGTVEMYSPASGAWTLATEMIRERTLFTMTVFSNGVVLIVGGLSNEPVMDEYLASCEFYVVPAGSSPVE